MLIVVIASTSIFVFFGVGFFLIQREVGVRNALPGMVVQVDMIVPMRDFWLGTWIYKRTSKIVV